MSQVDIKRKQTLASSLDITTSALVRVLMPLLKPISGHTSCSYLTKDGWALTTNYLNFDMPGHKGTAFGIPTSKSSNILCNTWLRIADKFRKLFKSLGVEVEDNSSKARQQDWAFSLADLPTCRVSDESLELGCGREYGPRKCHN